MGHGDEKETDEPVICCCITVPRLSSLRQSLSSLPGWGRSGRFSHCPVNVGRHAASLCWQLGWQAQCLRQRPVASVLARGWAPVSSTRPFCSSIKGPPYSVAAVGSSEPKLLGCFEAGPGACTVCLLPHPVGHSQSQQ